MKNSLDKNLTKEDKQSLRLLLMADLEFPIDPLEIGEKGFDLEARRLRIEGILESYHGNYDALAEGVQNAVDALEDAKLEDLPAPYLIEITINLDGNWIGILDTGIGMTSEQVAEAFAPQATFKVQTKRDKRNQYRGHKGVGLSFLSYGTDDIRLHSKQEGGEVVKTRMQYGRAWAMGDRQEAAVLNNDPDSSPLNRHSRGTYVQIQFSDKTHPRSLRHQATTLVAWKAILRSKTAVGQVHLGRDPIVPIKAVVNLINGGQVDADGVTPNFLYPHDVQRNPAFRFLNVAEYYSNNAEQAEPPADKLRQDGLYLIWDAERIQRALTADQQAEHAESLANYSPYIYAFVPYQGSVWGELNNLKTGVTNRTYLYPGLMLAVNGQRLADISPIKATRFEHFGNNVFVIVHFDGVKPDQGRKTISIEAEKFAQDAADRVVQYLGTQRAFLRATGEAPTPEQRAIEKDHSDWLYNVKKHAEISPLYIPPSTYLSTPQTEQDIIGLFHQLSVLNIFPGIRIYATSQSETYDCLVDFYCEQERPGLQYSEATPLGLSPYIIGEIKAGTQFATKELTLEFKNNLDRLIEEVDGVSPKNFNNIDICVCWGQISETFTGYEIEPITGHNLEGRIYPGITHLLKRDGNPKIVSVVMLKTVTDMIKAGQIKL